MREYVDEPLGVTKTDIDGDRALVVPVEDEDDDEADELAAIEAAGSSSSESVDETVLHPLTTL